MRLLRTFKRPIVLLVTVAVVVGWLKSLALTPVAVQLLGSVVLAIAVVFMLAVGIGKAMARQDKLDEKARLERLQRERQRPAKPASTYVTPPGTLDNLSPGTIRQRVLQAGRRDT